MQIELDKQIWTHELYMDAPVWRLYVHMLSEPQIEPEEQMEIE